MCAREKTWELLASRTTMETMAMIMPTTPTMVTPEPARADVQCT